MAQQVKDPALSLQHLRLLHGIGSDPGPGTSTLCGHSQREIISFLNAHSDGIRRQSLWEVLKSCI